MSQSDIEARRGEMDDDGDGYVQAEDCDDKDAAVSPGAAELWYDGRDSDCAGDDDYDADADGYVEGGAVGLSTEGVQGSGGLPGGDCNDAAAGANPSQEDAWYDGVDTDCDGADDYDQDKDGYVPSDYAGLATQNAPDTGALQGGDCDDLEEDVHPDAEDAWYDGVDTDCGGEDDYDADADGHVPDLYADAPTQYVDGSGALPADDCDDDNDAAFAGAEEYWYDGQDWDCGGDDDYDADADGYVPDLYEGLPTVGVAGSGELPAGDCEDAEAEVNPGALEDLFLSDPGSDSNLDRDCDGGEQSFYVAPLEGFSGWVQPFAPRFDENAIAVYLSLAAYEVTVGSSTYYDSALAVSFDNADLKAGVDNTYTWQKHVTDPPNYAITPGHDFLVTDDFLFGVTGLLFSEHRTLRFGGYNLISGASGIAGHLANTDDPDAAFDELTLAISGEDIYAFGCEDTTGVAQYVYTTIDEAKDSDVLAEATIPGFYASACELHLYEPGVGTIVSAQAAGLVTDQFALTEDEPNLEQVSLNSAYTPTSIEVPADGAQPWVVVADPDAIYVFDEEGIQYALAVGSGPTSVDAAYAPDGSLVIGYVDELDQPHVLYGDPTVSMERFDLTVDFSATETAVWIDATGDKLMVAVTGTSDVAFWLAELVP